MRRSKLSRLIQEMVDGTIQKSDLLLLEDELVSNEASRNLYLDTVEIHSLLESQESELALKTNVIPIGQIVRRQRLRTVRLASLSAAALFLFGFVVMQFLSVEAPPETVLSFKISPQTQFSITHSENEAGQPRAAHMAVGSNIQLHQGALELIFVSGVKSVVKAPANLTVLEDNKLGMSEGLAWFNVPKGAEGFQVNTDDLEIVDLGTEFGVLANPDGFDEVHVFTGRVQVSARNNSDEARTLLAGDASRINQHGGLQSIASRNKDFQSTLPTSLPYLHWSFDQDESYAATGDQLNVEGASALREGSISIEPGVNGDALSLNGEDQFMLTNWGGILSDRPRTVAFWVKAPKGENKGTTTLVAWGQQEKLNIPTNSKWSVHLDYGLNQDSTLNISFGGFWYYVPGLNLTDDTWHHVAVSYNGRFDASGDPAVQLYIDGKSRATFYDTHEPTPRDSSGRVVVNSLKKTPLSIGANLSAKAGEDVRKDFYFNGSIDELFVIEGALPQKSIRSLMQTHRYTN